MQRISSERNERYKKINNVVVGMYCILTILVAIKSFSANDFYPITQCVMGLVLLIIPLGIFKIAKMNPVYDVMVVYNTFCFLTVIVGSALRGYGNMPGWDKLLHFLSGFLMALVGVAIYEHGMKNIKKIKHGFKYSFILCFAIAGAALWEFYEYFLYVFFKIDALNVRRTGVHDTLLDMIVCTVGIVWMIGLIERERRTGKACYFIRVWNHFKKCNPHIYD